MAVEQARSCGYRKVGGFYLVGPPNSVAMHCDRLPYKIDNCPVCNSGLKFTRGWTWLQFQKYAGEHPDYVGPVNEREICTDSEICPICHPVNFRQPYGLLFVGEQFYSPEAFVKESLQLGISRRLPFSGNIPRMPKNFKLGETWVLFAHKHVIKGTDEKGNPALLPAIFHAFKPAALELLIWQKDATKERLEELQKAGITPIVIPDGDADHDPNTPIGLAKDDKEELEDKIEFNDLRSRLSK